MATCPLASLALLAILAGAAPEKAPVRPFESDAERVGEYDMCLIDPGTEYTIFIDPDNVAEPGQPWAWKPSKDYERERLDYINNGEDED